MLPGEMPIFRVFKCPYLAILIILIIKVIADHCPQRIDIRIRGGSTSCSTDE